MWGEIKVGGMYWVRDRNDRWISDEDNEALATEAAMLDEIERLRAAGDALAATWPEEERCGCNNPDCRAVVAAYDAWREARRG